MKSKLLISIFIFTIPVSAALRTSLAELLQGLPEAEITQEFRKPAPDANLLKAWTEATKKQKTEFKSRVLDSMPFVRGEIEQEKVMNSVSVLLQLSILQCRLEAKNYNEEIPLWFRFAGDMAYEESTLIGLRFSSLIRSLWLDELESIVKKDPDALEMAQAWIWNLRSAWPVDRVILEEGRKVLKPKNLVVIEKVMKDYQKNPYQTAEQMLKKVPGGKAAELGFIQKIWRTEDLEAMKTEMNRLNTLRVRSAQAKFKALQRKKAASYQELIDAKLVTTTPVDYFTGKPLAFP